MCVFFKCSSNYGDKVGLTIKIYISPQFMFLTYILALAFLAIFGFTAIPVFLFFNMWNTCAAMKSPDANITSPDSICVDVRQYGNSDKRCTARL